MRALCILIALCTVVPPACSDTAPTSATSPSGVRTPAPPAAAPTSSYKISSGDTLGIITWGEDRFSFECQVNSAGTISVPVAGDVPAAGLTCPELQEKLQHSLAKYLVEPQVTVTVKQYSALGASVFVLGEVKTPGMYPLPKGAAPMQAVAAAGGPTPNASDEITVAKAGSGECRTVSLQASTLMPKPEDALAPGDVVVVNRLAQADQPGRYAVLGEVPSPGMFDLPLKATVRVLDAMEKAGLLASSSGSGEGAHHSLLEDLSRTADFEHALLMRGEVVVPLNLKALLQGDASQNLILQADDVLTIPRRAVITVYAMGEVRDPGKQVLPVGAKVLDLLGAVEGAAPSARLAKAALIRMVDGKPTTTEVDLGRLLGKSDAKQNLPLQEGDVLFVPSKEQRDGGLLRWLPYLPYWIR